MLVLGRFEEFTSSPELASKPALFCGRVNGLSVWSTSLRHWGDREMRSDDLSPYVKCQMVTQTIPPQNGSIQSGALKKTPRIYVKITELLLLLFWSSSLCVWLGGGRYSLRPGSGASVVLAPVDIVDNASLSVCVGRVPECTCCTPPAISLLFSNLQQAWWMRTQLIAHCQLPLIPPSKNPKLKTMVLT